MRYLVFVLLATLLSGCSAAGVLHGAAPSNSESHARASHALTGADLIKHIVIITMENRSFDEMFGTYPGVDGLPNPLPCNPDPNSGQTVCSYKSDTLVEYGGPHGDLGERIDLDHGKLDGFIKAAEMIRKGNP